jgi:hypothetical protein
MPPLAPAPYAAGLALSIDCDGCTLDRLYRVFRFWATDEATEFGRCLSLPLASSMFLYSRNPQAPPQVAYLDGDRAGLLEAYRRGWIDSLHSIGDFSAAHPPTRELALRGFDALDRDGVKIDVWTNHGGPDNVQNLIRANALGDVPGSPAYLSDRAHEYGIRFVFASELTHVIGQERPLSTTEYYATYPSSPFRRFSSRLLHPLSGRLVRKLNIEPMSDNRLLRPAVMRDGRTVWTFRRYGLWRRDTISQLPRILSPDVLDRLVESRGMMTVYLHIGRSADETPENFVRGLQALREVERRYRDRALWVAKTSDLLRYCAAACNPENRRAG